MRFDALLMFLTIAISPLRSQMNTTALMQMQGAGLFPTGPMTTAFCTAEVEDDALAGSSLDDDITMYL